MNENTFKTIQLELIETFRSIHFLIIFILVALSFTVYYGWREWFDWYWIYFMFEFRYYVLGTLLFVPFIYSSFAFRWRTSVTLCNLVLIALIPLIITYHRTNLTAIILNIVFLSIPILIAAIISLIIDWRDKQKRILAEREKERQVYMMQILKAHEDERRRVAQELHDDTTQTLVALASNISTLMSGAKSKTNSVSIEDMKSIRETIVQIVEDLRRLCFDLRPAILDTMGLLPALNWLIDKVRQECNIKTSLVINSETRSLRPEDDVIIFRVIQEALNNIRKHSEATKAAVILNYKPMQLEIAIKDNGKGFIVPKEISTYSTDGKLGLVGVRQRTRALGGAFNIQSEIGKGTVVLVELPV